MHPLHHLLLKASLFPNVASQFVKNPRHHGLGHIDALHLPLRHFTLCCPQSRGPRVITWVTKLVVVATILFVVVL